MFGQLSVFASKIIVDIIQLINVQIKMSRFFHGGFVTIHGLQKYFKQINVYNTNVGSIIPQNITFKSNKMSYYSLKQSSCNEYSKQFKVAI